MSTSLCHTCVHCQTVVSGRGSTFYLCRLSQTVAANTQSNPRFSKYPPQPVVRCPGYVAKPAEEPADDGR